MLKEKKKDSTRHFIPYNKIWETVNPHSDGRPTHNHGTLQPWVLDKIVELIIEKES